MAQPTLEQMKQAVMNKKLKDIQKRLALSEHKQTVEWVTKYNLPYKIAHDYITGENDIMEVRINDFYPLPKVPIEGEWNSEKDGGYTREQWLDLITEENGEKIHRFTEPPADIQALIDEKAKPYKLWNLETEQGKMQWFYWFMVFIIPYKDRLQGFTCFDMWGNSKLHTAAELEQRKAYYMDLMRKAEEQPDSYQHHRQQKQLSDYDKYNFDSLQGYMWHDSITEPTPPKCDRELAIQIMEKEIANTKASYETLKREDMGYCPNFDIEAKNEHSKAYRMIKILENLKNNNEQSEVKNYV